jgi:hypothetical protein
MRGATQVEDGEFRQGRQSTEAGRTLRDYFFCPCAIGNNGEKTKLGFSFVRP